LLTPKHKPAAFNPTVARLRGILDNPDQPASITQGQFDHAYESLVNLAEGRPSALDLENYCYDLHYTPLQLDLFRWSMPYVLDEWRRQVLGNTDSGFRERFEDAIGRPRFQSTQWLLDAMCRPGQREAVYAFLVETVLDRMDAEPSLASRTDAGNPYACLHLWNTLGCSVPTMPEVTDRRSRGSCVSPRCDRCTRGARWVDDTRLPHWPPTQAAPAALVRSPRRSQFMGVTRHHLLRRPWCPHKAVHHPSLTASHGPAPAQNCTNKRLCAQICAPVYTPLAQNPKRAKMVRMAHSTTASAAALAPQSVNLADLIPVEDLAAAIRAAFSTLVALMSDAKAPARERRSAACTVLRLGLQRPRVAAGAGDGPPSAHALAGSRRPHARTDAAPDAAPDAEAVRAPSRPPRAVLTETGAREKVSTSTPPAVPGTPAAQPLQRESSLARTPVSPLHAPIPPAPRVPVDARPG
jgi:hypothetical protein